MTRPMLAFVIAAFFNLSTSPVTSAQIGGGCGKNCGCNYPVQVGHRGCSTEAEPYCHVTWCNVRNSYSYCAYDLVPWNDVCAEWAGNDWHCNSVFLHNCGDC